MRGNLPIADLLLDRIRKQLHESKTAGYPTDAPIKLSCQIIEVVPETMFQFGQQPTLLKRAGALGAPHRVFEHQSFGLVHRPNGCPDRVPAQLFQRRHALVTIDHPIPIRLPLHGHNNDRNLLA